MTEPKSKSQLTRMTAQGYESATPRIDIGDVVTVKFNNGRTLDGVVYRVPCDTGDCWIIEEPCGRKEEHVLHYVQTFEEIIKRR